MHHAVNMADVCFTCN